MNIGKFLSSKVMVCMNALAMLLVMQTANSACIWVAYQPEFPDEAIKLNKEHIISK